MDTYLRIAHSIFEQLISSQFSLRQWRIVFLILRLSWGCGKKTAFILQRDFEVVGVSECHIKATIDSLIQAGVVIRKGRYYSFNTDFEKWQVGRAPQYQHRKFSALVCLNLKVTDPREGGNLPDMDVPLIKPAESESPDFLKRKVITYRNGKLAEPELASAKERLNRYIRLQNGE